MPINLGNTSLSQKLDCNIRRIGRCLIFTSPKLSLINVSTWPKLAIHQISVNARFRCTRDMKFCHLPFKNLVQKPFLCAFSPPVTHAAISVTRHYVSAHEDGCSAVLGFTGNFLNAELNRRPQIARRSERSLLFFL